MKEKILTLDNLKNKLLSFSLTVTLISAVLYLYQQSYFNIYFVASTIFAAFLYVLFDFVAYKKIIGNIIYTAAFMLMCGLAVLIINVQGVSIKDSVISFIEWFFSGGQAVQTEDFHTLLLSMISTFFISSVVYYFTNQSYRTFMLMVISLIPCVLYIKAAASLPTFYAVIAAGLNLFLYLKNCRREINFENTVCGNRFSKAVYVDFAAAALLLAFIIPKPTQTPYYDLFESLTSNFTIGGFYGHSGKYTKTSGNADNFLNMENILLYIVSTNNPEYFKIQTFDGYDSEHNCWVMNSQNSSGYPGWENERSKLNFSSLQKALAAAAENNPELLKNYNLDKLLSLEFNDEICFAKVRTIEYPSEYFISPLRTMQFIGGENSHFEIVYMTKNGEVFPDSEMLEKNEEYSIYYYDDNFLESSGWLDAGGCNFSFEDYRKLLASAHSSLENDSNSTNIENAKVIKAFINENNDSAEFKPDDTNYISSEIKSLAEKITDGLIYDWQKAEAIEAFFHKGDFTYSLGYKAPKNNDTTDYFLFTSKKGTCSDFASAYCLLAKASGLYVRYAEGFVPDQMNNSKGIYQIFTENAHAYPEVYIPGGGWQIYEPTVADMTAQSRATGQNENNDDFLTKLVTVLTIVMIIVIIAFIMILMPKIKESVFRIYIRSASSSKAVIILYNKHCAVIEKLFGIDTKALTAEQISKLTNILTFESSEDFRQAFSKACYSEKAVTDIDKKKALECYIKQFKLLKKRRKSDRKHHIKQNYIELI